MRALKSNLAAFAALAGLALHAEADPLVIAPSVDGLDICQDAANDPAIGSAREAEYYCFHRGQTPASRIKDALDSIGSGERPRGPYILGYTLPFPLLRYYYREGGRLLIDKERIKYSTRVITEVDRPVVLYLFSNHFGGASDSDLDRNLAQESGNSLTSQKGNAITPDSYFETTVYPWNFANPNAEINVLRKKAITAVLDEICHLPDIDRQKIIGVNLLGEVHHLFPHFFNGMGFDQPFVITDYSDASIVGFRAFLQTKFRSLDALNAAIGATFSSFDEVNPPSKDIRSERLLNFIEHIDRHAHGIVPIFGWARDLVSGEVQVAIYLDGVLQGVVRANLNRLDVAEVKPEIGTPNVGWRYDLDFSVLTPGHHRLDVFADRGSNHLIRLATRDLVVMDRRQSPPQFIPVHALPAAGEYVEGSSLKAWVDYPPNQIGLFYNPLAKFWLEFRNKEVADYIAAFSDIVAQSCLRRDIVFSHQIAPQFNGSWDRNLFAVDQSLEPNQLYHLGVNLYGGATYGRYFHEWLKQLGHQVYAIPEFHPMTELSQETLIRIFDQHRTDGARYIAPYYISIRPERMWTPSDHNKFRIDAKNNEYGSASLFRAIQALIRD